MNTLAHRLFFIAGMILLSACNDYLDVNDDLDNPSTTEPQNLLPAILGNAATLTYNAGEISAYYSQQLVTETGFDRTRDRWDFSQEVRVGIFRHHYFDVAGNAHNLINTAADDELAKNYTGVGQIMQAYAFLITTDVLGDMPYEEAFTGKDSPKYDTQEEVYEQIGLLLDEGIQNLQEAIAQGNTAKPMTASDDVLFSGDLTAWTAFAHGIKARWLLHQKNVASDMGKVIEEVNTALSNWVTPSYIFSGVDTWTQNPWGPLQARPLLFSMRANVLSNSVPSTFFLDLMKSDTELDPRAFKHFEPNEGGEILSLVSGEGRGGIDGDDLPNLLDMALTKDDSPLAFMTESELFFIRAEAQFESDKTAAYNSYLSGIISNMQQLEVDQGEQDTFLSNSDLVVQSSDDLTLSDIMVQKLIATYLSPEAWVDIRRYNWDPNIYPELSRPTNVAEDIYGTDKWITRVPYNMETEYIYNLPEIDRLGAREPEFLTVKLWWMQQ
ncbi:SusD/RagB family nutrient-binding outer membrane lipoprotein [Fulvivirga sp. M361]|uniref:SusD/RagB family nutrient-binding outer membrane lipoprotein n=1 Tax=Fulvivirga sp. M361 TaxID=2594266 RepID=UPI001627017F|nr:SusD/RagB family nutrient-binding outer membrane lipoprotein [Fulvivirga sp. M361]